MARMVLGTSGPRRILAIIALSFLLGLSALYGCTHDVDTPFTNEEVYLLFDSGESPDSPGKSSVKTVLHYRGETYLLLPTFDDSQVAIRDFMLRYPDVLQKLELTNPFLGPLNMCNYGLYRGAASAHAGSPLFESEEDAAALMDLLCFIDILENEDANRRILALAEAGDVEGVMAELPDQETLSSNLG